MTARTARRAGEDDQTIALRLCRWFHRNKRSFPWRAPRRDPYHALVAEAMLQQTQASRVVDKFDAFVTRFPTVESLARAREDSVLAAWSGLGYYRRARSLRSAAKRIVAEHGGRVPRDVDALRALPGVGRYTAGAIASIVYDRPAPIVDGNVARVLMRLEGAQRDPDAPDTRRWLWKRAEELVRRADSTSGAKAGTFNEALMELGATVCRPVGPRCEACPLAATCRARRDGATEEIPAPRKRAARKTVHHGAVIVRDARGRVLLERRPDEGLWGGLWQTPTLERVDRPVSAVELRRWLGVNGLTPHHRFVRQTTHRQVQFVFWRAEGSPISLNGTLGGGAAAGRRWVAPSGLARLPLATPHRTALSAEDG